MEQSPDQFLPILFKVLFAFIILNTLVNFVLLLTKQKRIYKMLALYWPSVLAVFILQGAFQTGLTSVVMAYSLTLLPLTIFSMIGFEVLGRKFPLRPYLLYYALFYPITYALGEAGYGFTTVAMPFAIATATPILHTCYYLLIKDYKRSTRLQKILGVIGVTIAVHCINYALFRMDPGAQLWGWLVTYAQYDSLAILLPSIALEEANMSENDRLQNLVNVKTEELNRSLKENQNLIKVLLHDLSSPMMTMRFYLDKMKAIPENDSLLDKARKTQLALDNILMEIKKIYSLKNNKGKVALRPVELNDCFNDVQMIFGQMLEKKNITLVFTNQLSPSTKVLADQTTLTHSVLSNLVSNGLKFSKPDTQIHVVAKEIEGNVVLEIKDEGPGIPAEIIENLMFERENQSSEGTHGETGSGFGLSIVKSFVDAYGGQIEFEVKSELSYPPGEHGTCIRITLSRA